MNKTQNQYYEERFNFFYYWLGEIVYEELEKKNDFKTALSEIYEALKISVPAKKCEAEDHKNSHHDFEQRKTVFDYWYNHETIKQYLENGDKGGCGGKYATYLDKIVDDYNNMNSHCATKSDDQDSYCKKVRKVFEGNNSPDQLKSKCAIAHKDKFTSLSKGPDSKELPSEQAYALLDGGPWCQVLYAGHDPGQKKEQEIKTQLEKILRDYTNIPQKDESFANKILQNYCYACWMKEQFNTGKETDDDNTPCYFLFFWICTQIKNKLKENMHLNGNFQKAMKAIYDALAKFPWNGISKERKCTNIYPDIMESLFEAFKIFFDYEYNIKAIEKKPECNKYFSSQYTKDRSNAQGWYSWSCKFCGTTNNEYCKNFKVKYIDEGKCNSPLQLPELTCTPIAVKPATAAKPEATRTCSPGSPELDCAGYQKPGSSGSGSTETCNLDSSGRCVHASLRPDGVFDGEGKGGSDGGGSHRKEGEQLAVAAGSIVPTAVSGGLAVYTNLFSGIRDTLSGSIRSRKKRSVRQELNAFSGGDSSTTEYAATTVGSSSNLSTRAPSTIADSTDTSTIYGRSPPSGRGRANNSNNRRGNENRRTISYQRM
ncbi:KIR protein [Plasmodium coatneyi]|uniref:KIR protein n=1 Tax=Plasmodium coatneyi TaxID=208452 RepID=A0A1B1E0B6_9APIC|nr:KIR protein [Plasmodium coatneyi]ANQ08335.1 KIR protein [Plasmodium coatneyi]